MGDQNATITATLLVILSVFIFVTLVLVTVMLEFRIAACLLIVNAVKSLEPSKNRRLYDNPNDQKPVRRVLKKLANIKSYFTGHDRKTFDPDSLSRARSVFDALSKKVPNMKNVLRQVAPSIPDIKLQSANNQYQGLVEKELENTHAKKGASLMQPVYVEQKGQNDFLVLGADARDPFVTVIPNNIYYNIEKKCVNWLEDCSIKGIRARLLEKFQSPHRK